MLPLPPPILLHPSTAAALPPLPRCRGIGTFLLNLEVESVIIAMRTLITKYSMFSFFVYSMISFIVNVLVKILMVVKQEIPEWKKMFG
jgi:hypothetical protein